MEKKFWQTWWFWVIVATLTIGIILAIVLPIVYLTGGGDGKPQTPNDDEVTFSVEFKFDENDERFDWKYEDYDKVDILYQGQASLGLFDNNDNLIKLDDIDFDNLAASSGELIDAYTKTETVVTHVIIWDSYEKLSNSSTGEYSNAYRGEMSWEKIHTISTDTEIYNELDKDWSYEDSANYFEKFDIRKATVETKNDVDTSKISYKNYTNSDTGYNNMSLYEYSTYDNITGEDEIIDIKNSYIEFDYFKTYYMR